MKKLSISFTVKKLIQKINNDNIKFNNPLQRKPEQWSQEQKSLLVHSLVSDYPVPPLYAVQDDNKYSILDGKQRLTVIGDFVKDQWKLSEDMPEVNLNGISYNISGLGFSELDEEIKDELKDASLLMYIFEDCSDEEIEEIFYRLNNGEALTKDQKTRARLGNDLVKFIDNILETEFFKKKAYFTNYQLRRAEDQTCILQTLMLLNNYVYKSFGGNDILKFVQVYRNNFKQEELQLCKDLFNKLNECFTEKNKLIKKIHIPMFVMALKTSQDKEIPFNEFKAWINYFVNNYDSSSKYASYCSGNTTNREKVNKRIELITKDLIGYVASM